MRNLFKLSVLLITPAVFALLLVSFRRETPMVLEYSSESTPTPTEVVTATPTAKPVVKVIRSTSTPTPKPTATSVPNYQPAQQNTYSYVAPTSYPPCTLFYSALGYSQTYTHISPEECKNKQASLNASNATPTNLPTPTEFPIEEARSICRAEADTFLGNGDESGRFAAGSYYCVCMGNYGFNVPCPPTF